MTFTSKLLCGLAVLLCAAAARGETVGKPINGGRGITETIDQIMAREALAPKNKPPHVARLGRRPLSTPLVQGNAASETLGPSVGTREAVGVAPRSPQVAGTNFLAVTYSTANALPPDTEGAIGPTQIFVCLNGRFRLFDRAGNIINTLNADSDVFFGSVLASGTTTTDPRVRYDRASQRWFVQMIDELNASNTVYYAVSSGSTLTSTSSFTFFKFTFDSAQPNSKDTGGFLDYDTLGIDANALYTGGSIFPKNNGTVVGNSVFIVNKASLISGTLVYTPFRQIASTGANVNYTFQGVINDDAGATEGYFIGADVSTMSQLLLFRVSNPGGTPTLSSAIPISVPAFDNSLGTNSGGGMPGNGGVTAKGSDSPIDDNDLRLFQATIHNGSLYTAHNIEVDASGNPVSGGGRDGARWYEITGLTGTPSLRQSGVLFDPSGNNPRSYFFPTCVCSGQGHMALGSSMAGANDYIGVAAAGRLASDALGTLQAATIVTPGAASYNAESFVSSQRWGDYSSTFVDPNDNMSIWTFQEYTNSQDIWGVRVVQLKAPPPATPSSVSQAALPSTGSNISVTVTGTSVNGSAFYDPGAGFPNHISASVSGSGVTVNSATYVDPTHVTLNLSTNNAPGGGRTITITNPDGQSVTSATNLLCISTGSGTIGLSVSGPTAADTGVPFFINVAAVDVCGAPQSNYTGTVSFTSDDPNATLPGNYTFVASDNGARMFMVTLVKLGSVKITATDAVNSLSGSLTVTVTTLPAFSFAPSGTPSPGVVGMPVTFSAVATSAFPTSFGYAWNFGDSMTGSGQQPQHTYTNPGTFTVQCTAQDDRGGTVTASISFTVTPLPVISSGPVAAPNPAGVGQTITFTASASEVGGDALSYSWDFGDGTGGSGASTTHSYSPAGVYTAVVTVSDTRGGQITGTVQVSVKAPIVGIGNDSDGDGYSDTFEIQAGSDPNNAASVPGGVSLANGTQTLNVTKLTTRLNFAHAGKDTITAAGTLPISAGFSVAGAYVASDIGGVPFIATLDSKGHGGKAFKLTVKSIRGVVSAQSAKFTLTLPAGNYAATLANSGLTNTSVKAKSVTVVWSIIFNGAVYQAQRGGVYTATQNKMGSSK
ncbi:MAG TPA: PKD domain-containing protein [Planctomycetota bacterium]|nr:PKD domain-containing protein [Planctomycetota bacterium]